MDSTKFEKIQRQGEMFHNLRIPNGVYPIIRVDGRGFSKYTNDHYEKPFDIRFRDRINEAALELFKEMDAIYAYSESDEISILLHRDWSMFDRSWEKAVSVSAGIISSAFSDHDGTHFDSRVHVAADMDAVKDYFSWRQADAKRCALNGWVYWTHRHNGFSGAAADSNMRGMSVAAKIVFLEAHGILWDREDPIVLDDFVVPNWQKHGVGIRWLEYEKQGFNPMTNQNVTVIRRALMTDYELPTGDEYRALLDYV